MFRCIIYDVTIWLWCEEEVSFEAFFWGVAILLVSCAFLALGMCPYDSLRLF